MSEIDLGQTIQILANVGVLVGLVVLILELRHNNEQLTAQSRFNYYHNRIAEARLVSQQPDLIEIAIRAGNGEAVSDVDRIRITYRLSSLLTCWEYEYGEYQKGRIAAEEFNVSAKRRIYQNSGALRMVWSELKATTPKSFREFMERAIE